MSSSNIGPRLFWARERAGLTHRMLGTKANVSPGTISGLENGKHAPTTDTVERLAHALGVEPCWLAYGDRDKAPADWTTERRDAGK